jgi:hypothetical protein
MCTFNSILTPDHVPGLQNEVNSKWAGQFGTSGLQITSIHREHLFTEYIVLLNIYQRYRAIGVELSMYYKECSWGKFGLPD